MKYEPLTEENIREAIVLVEKVFPEDAKMEDGPAKAYLASIRLDEYAEFLAKYHLKTLKYFLVRDEESGAPLGVTGWYTRSVDSEKLVWLGWYCVVPEYRGKGLGRVILEWTIERVKEKGFTTMWLYTSTDPDEARAQVLYEKLGFKIIKKEDDPESPYMTLYRERTL